MPWGSPRSWTGSASLARIWVDATRTVLLGYDTASMARTSPRRILKMVAACVAASWIALFFYLRNPVLGPGARLPSATSADPARLRAHVDALASLVPSRSLDHPESLLVAEAYVAAQLRAMGYQVDAQEVRPWSGRTAFHNLVAIYGPRDARERVVLGAHVDACGDDNPGADDDASGVAVLLEVARALRTARPEVAVPIELVAYTLEEPPVRRWGASTTRAACASRAWTSA
jgi:hypothetical protein